MTAEKILTNEEIITIGQQARAVEPGGNLYIRPIKFARAIEQAVLKSLPAQTSSAIRADSYAGVYIWFGRDKITQHIPKCLAENASNPHGLLECVAAECIRNLEQAVLQSPEVQEWKRDNERMKAALKRIANMDSMSYHTLDSAKITAKAAMEQK